RPTRRRHARQSRGGPRGSGGVDRDRPGPDGAAPPARQLGVLRSLGTNRVRDPGAHRPRHDRHAKPPLQHLRARPPHQPDGLLGALDRHGGRGRCAREAARVEGARGGLERRAAPRPRQGRPLPAGAGRVRRRPRSHRRRAGRVPRRRAGAPRRRPRRGRLVAARPLALPDARPGAGRAPPRARACPFRAGRDGRRARREHARPRLRLRLRRRRVRAARVRGGVAAPRARPGRARRVARGLRSGSVRGRRDEPGGRARVSDGPLEQALRDANAELLRRIEDLSFVRVVGDALAGAVEPAAIGTALVTLLRDELRADLAALWAVDELGTGVRLVAVCRTGEDAPARGASDGPLVPFSAGALGTAAAGHVVAIPDVDAAAAGDVPSEAADGRALLLHPVGARGRTLGVVALGSSEPHGLDAGHERLLGLVAPLVGMALESAALYGRVSVENRALRAELGERYGRAGLVGSSPAFRRLLALIERLADVDVTVLVLGASGTGKEMVARALHWGGRRRDAPFVAINCAALPEALLESELFGIERGVATGVERRAGLIERATGGTLFLDEIGD